MTSSTADASDIYDRQIRLWGADAQSKISSAQILYVGLTGVSMEILKNLVLAGVQPAILDGRPYPEGVLNSPSSFFPVNERLGKEIIPKMTVAKAIQSHVHELNPLLKEAELNETENLSDVPDAYFSKFDVVICSTKVAGFDQVCRIAAATTKGGGKFFAADTFGLAGVAVLDLGLGHKFRREIGKNKLSDWESFDFPPLKGIFSKKLGDISDRWNKTVPTLWAAYQSFVSFAEQNEWPSQKCSESYAIKTKQYLENEGLTSDFLGPDENLIALATIAGAEVSPVCAVLGGVLGQEIIKALSGKGEPAKNILLFDGIDGGCKAIYVQ